MLQAYKKNYKQFIDKYKKVKIPNYQREYVWSENEWEDFLNDILNIVKLDFKPHFMGTLLLKENSTNFEIIDGQQRLITLNIFLMAYRDAYSDRLKFKYTVDYLNDKIIVNDNDNIYNALFNKTYIKGKRTINDSQSINIEKAYQYFLKKFQVKGLFGKVTTDFNLSRVFNKLFFITIEIENTTNPYLIFETLNARGIDLNISDLVKNHLLDLSKEDIVFNKFINDEWSSLTSGVSLDEFEKIFQSFYQSSNNRKKLLKEITGTINDESEIRDFLRNLGSYVYMYKKLSNTDSQIWNGDNELINYVKFMNSYKNNHLFKIVMIPLFNNFKRGKIKTIFNFIEALIFRYTTICQKDQSKLLEKLYIVAQKINNKSLNNLTQLKEELSEYTIDDEEFKYSFAYRSIEYSHNYSNPMVRYILYKLENKISNSNLILGLSDASVEHIDSQSSAQFNVVYRLGNYALLTKKDNEDARNKTFVDKKERFYTNNSGFSITFNDAQNVEIKGLNKYIEWNIEKIKERQFEMAEVAIKVWKI